MGGGIQSLSIGKWKQMGTQNLENKVGVILLAMNYSISNLVNSPRQALQIQSKDTAVRKCNVYTRHSVYWDPHEQPYLLTIQSA